MSPVEIEATLVICAEQPEAVASDIAALDRVGDYRLMPRESVAIRDIYLDLAGGSLRSLGLGVRLRAEGEQRLITFKGPSEEVAGGGIRRPEFEMPWSGAALDAVFREMAAYGVAVPEPWSLRTDQDSLQTMLGFGFVVEQERDTVRRPRGVTAPVEPATTLAELVVDSVVYHFGGRDIRHHEVEIEAADSGSVGVMQEVARALLVRWPSALRTWHHGKRATGRAVEALLGEGVLKGLVAETGDLKPAAYDVLEARLH